MVETFAIRISWQVCEEVAAGFCSEERAHVYGLQDVWVALKNVPVSAADIAAAREVLQFGAGPAARRQSWVFAPRGRVRRLRSPRRSKEVTPAADLETRRSAARRAVELSLEWAFGCCLGKDLDLADKTAVSLCVCVCVRVRI